MDDHKLLLAIQERLDGVEWSSDIFEEIAQLMVNSGYRIRDSADVDREPAEPLHATVSGSTDDMMWPAVADDTHLCPHDHRPCQAPRCAVCPSTGDA